MNGPAPGRLSRRGGTRRKPGSLCRGPAGGAGSQGFRSPSPGLVGPSAGAHRPLRNPQGGRSPPLGSTPTPGTDPNPQQGSRRSPCTRAPKFRDSGGVTATSEPFLRRRRQVSGGPGGSRGQIPEAGLAAPSGGWREPAARAPRRSAEVPSPRRTCAPESYLWALAGVPSSLCSSTAPWQTPAPAARLRCLARRLLPAPPGRLDRRPAGGQSPARRGATGRAAPLPSRSVSVPLRGSPGLRADPANQ